MDIEEIIEYLEYANEQAEMIEDRVSAPLTSEEAKLLAHHWLVKPIENNEQEIKYKMVDIFITEEI